MFLVIIIIVFRGGCLIFRLLVVFIIVNISVVNIFVLIFDYILDFFLRKVFRNENVRLRV